MRALTLHRPWPWAILTGKKDVENRTWSAAWVVGEVIAIHAGLQVGSTDAFAFIERVCGRRPPADGGPLGIVGVARVEAMVVESPSPWFMGPVGWQLADVRALAEPVPCSGKQGLWPVPPHLEAEVLAQLALGTRRGG